MLRSEPDCSALKGHFVMVACIAAVVALFTILDIHISLALIDPTDSTTWPHMRRPQLAYGFIPVLAAAVALAAVVVNFMLGILLQRRLARTAHWALLGAAYALVSVAQPVSALGINDAGVLGVASAAAVLSAALVRWRLGVPRALAAG